MVCDAPWWIVPQQFVVRRWWELVSLAGTLQAVQLGANFSSGYYGWTWHSGNNLGNRHSRPGIPGARAGAASWASPEGHMWMFGGRGFDIEPSNEPQVLSDLWFYNSSTYTWTLLHNGTSTTPDQLVPLPREKAVACGVPGIVLIIYGGHGNKNHVHKDLWIYNMSTASWLPLRAARKTQIPPGRSDAAHWCLRDRMVVFGGVGEQGMVFSDMWQFSFKNLTWIEIGGQITDVTLPHGRYGSATWRVDHRHDLYMFGGTTSDTGALHYELSDMWVYSMYNRTWTGMSCALTCGPSSRRHSATWREECGQLWLYGGQGPPDNMKNHTASSRNLVVLADLWHYDLLTAAWTLADTSPHKPFLPPSYQTHPHPGARCSAMSWQTKHSQMLLFGGLGLDGRHQVALLNDLWQLALPVPASIETTQRQSWFQNLRPATVFLMCFASIGGVALTFAVGLFVKKMIELPRHRPSGEFIIKYSKLKQQET